MRFNNASMSPQGLSTLVTEAMRDAHSKSVAVRLGLYPHPWWMSQSIFTRASHTEKLLRVPCTNWRSASI